MANVNDVVNKEDKICPICFDSLDKDVVSLTCAHVYHEKCIREWMTACKDTNKPSVCPECRVNI
jgi:hypothetical protein